MKKKTANPSPRYHSLRSKKKTWERPTALKHVRLHAEQLCTSGCQDRKALEGMEISVYGGIDACQGEWVSGKVDRWLDGQISSSI